MKIQIMGGKVGLRCKGKTLLGIANKLFVHSKFVDNAQQCLAKKNENKKFKCSQLLEGDRIESRLPFKIFSTLLRYSSFNSFSVIETYRICKFLIEAFAKKIAYVAIALLIEFALIGAILL